VQFYCTEGLPASPDCTDSTPRLGIDQLSPEPECPIIKGPNGSDQLRTPERQPALRSPYTLENPPPDEPPSEVLVPSLWRVQARWWKRHTPAIDQRDAKHPVCSHCAQSWPCHSWACWDGQLGQAVGQPPVPESVGAPAIAAASVHAASRALALSGVPGGKKR